MIYGPWDVAPTCCVIDCVLLFFIATVFINETFGVVDFNHFLLIENIVHQTGINPKIIH